jgi:molecular chaperone DnaK
MKNFNLLYKTIFSKNKKYFSFKQMKTNSFFKNNNTSTNSINKSIFKFNKFYFSIIGMDIGGTNTCMAILEASGPRVIENAEGLRTTPSVVIYFDGNKLKEEEKTLVTINAKKQSIQYSKNCFYGLNYLFSNDKALINKIIEKKRFPYTIEIDNSLENISTKDISLKTEQGQVFNPIDTSSLFLKYCKEQADGLLGKNIKKVVLAIPSYLNNENSKRDMKQALNLVGLEPIIFIEEAQASIIGYEAYKKNNILIFNLGGTGFSLFYLEKKAEEKNKEKENKEEEDKENSDKNKNLKEKRNPLKDALQFEIKKSFYDPFTGGEIIDNLIVNNLVEEFRKKNKIDLTKEPASMQRIQEAAEKAKIELSLSSQIEINLPFIIADNTGPKHLQTMIPRSKFERQIDTFTSQIKKHCESFRKEIENKEIDDILIVGGTTRIPCIQEIIKQVFKKEPNKSLNPEEAPAIGASIIADSLKSISEEKVSFETLPLSIGIETLGGKFCSLLEKGIKLPCVKNFKFSTVYDNQPSVNLIFFMGERAVASENRLIGTVSKSIPLAKKGELMIDVSLKVDENGNMNVKATESTLSKKSVSYSIDLNNGLNPEILEDVLEISNKFKEVDDFESNKLQLRADIDNFIYVLKDELKKFGKEVDSANSNSESSIKEESENAENLIDPIINKIQLHSEDLEKLISEISFNTEEVLTKYQEIHNLLGELVNSNNTKKLEEEK